MSRHSKYSPEVRERAVRMVFDHGADYDSEWAAIQAIADMVGCSGETLRKWVRRAETDEGRRPGLTTSERERLKALERENLQLRRANEILRKASAYFAQGGARPPTEVMVAFIDEHRGTYGVESICAEVPIAPSVQRATSMPSWRSWRHTAIFDWIEAFYTRRYSSRGCAHPSPMSPPAQY